MEFITCLVLSYLSMHYYKRQRAANASVLVAAIKGSGQALLVGGLVSVFALALTNAALSSL